MAAIGSWNSLMPSGTSSIADGDDLLRSHWSVLEEGWKEEHFWSGNSTGVHTFGSGRPFYGARSAVSTRGDTARLMLTSDVTQLWSVGSGLSQLLTPRPNHLIESYQSSTGNCIWVESNFTSVNNFVPTFGITYGAPPIVQVSVQTSDHTDYHVTIYAVSVSSVSLAVRDHAGALVGTNACMLHIRSLGTILAP